MPPRETGLPLLALLATAHAATAVDLAWERPRPTAGTTNLWQEYLLTQGLVDPQARNAGTPIPTAADSAPGAAIQATVAVHAGSIGYTGATPRDHARLAGAYLGVTIPALGVLEAGVERLRISYVRGDTLLQSDLTLVAGRWFRDFTWWLRTGIHAVDDHDQDWRAGRTAIVGAWWVPDARWRLGCDVYASRFAVADPALTVWQASPMAAWCWTQAAIWSLGQDVGATVIHLDQDAGFDRRTLWSAETRLRGGWNQWWGSVEAWAGQRLYAVTAGGWTVYDLPALYRHGIAGSIGRSLGARATLSATAGRDAFRHPWTDDQARAYRIVIALGLTF